MKSTAIPNLTPNPGLFDALNMELTGESATHVTADMPVTVDVLQPHGFLHGGATLALLESVASWGATIDADLDVELPFGVRVDVKHVKSCESGTVHGEATLNRVEDQGIYGRKMYWDVVATDDAGDVLSTGTFVTKTVSLERLAQKKLEADRASRTAEAHLTEKV